MIPRLLLSRPQDEEEYIDGYPTTLVGSELASLYPNSLYRQFLKSDPVGRVTKQALERNNWFSTSS